MTTHNNTQQPKRERHFHLCPHCIGLLKMPMIDLVILQLLENAQDQTLSYGWLASRLYKTNPSCPCLTNTLELMASKRLIAWNGVTARLMPTNDPNARYRAKSMRINKANYRSEYLNNSSNTLIFKSWYERSPGQEILAMALFIGALSLLTFAGFFE